jgi:hypothetical protein
MNFSNQRVKVSDKSSPFSGLAGRVIGVSKGGEVIVEVADEGRECVHFKPGQLEILSQAADGTKVVG